MKWGAFGTAAVLALPTPALATTWTVNPSSAQGCSMSSPHCRSLAEVASASPASGDLVDVAAANYSDSPTFTVPLTIEGNGPGVAKTTGTIAFSLSGNATSTPVAIKRLVVLPRSGDALSVTAGPTVEDWSVELESSILSGTSTGAG